MNVTDSLRTTYGDTLTISGKEDTDTTIMVIVEVSSESGVTSITGLSEDETVTFKGKVYEYIDNAVKGAVIKYTDTDSEVNTTELNTGATIKKICPNSMIREMEVIK